MPEVDLWSIQEIADELRTALDADGEYLMGLTDDTQEKEMIAEMVEEGVCAIDWVAFRYIGQRVPEQR